MESGSPRTVEYVAEAARCSMAVRRRKDLTLLRQAAADDGVTGLCLWLLDWGWAAPQVLDLLRARAWQEVCLTGGGPVPEEVIEQLCRMPSLGGVAVDGVGVDGVRALCAAPALANLRILDLEGIPSEPEIVDLLANATFAVGLWELFAYEYRVGAEAVGRLARAMPELQVLCAAGESDLESPRPTLSVCVWTWSSVPRSHHESWRAWRAIEAEGSEASALVEELHPDALARLGNLGRAARCRVESLEFVVFETPAALPPMDWVRGFPRLRRLRFRGDRELDPAPWLEPALLDRLAAWTYPQTLERIEIERINWTRTLLRSISALEDAMPNRRTQLRLAVPLWVQNDNSSWQELGRLQMIGDRPGRTRITFET